MRRLVPAVSLGLLLAQGCMPAHEYSAPKGATLDMGPLDARAQSTRWACGGWDLVLVGDKLRELNHGYLMANATPAADGTEYHYSWGSFTVLFTVPKDPTKPLVISSAGTIEVARLSRTTSYASSGGSGRPRAPARSARS